MTPDQAPSTPQDRERAIMHRIAFQLVKSSLIDWVNGVRLTPSEADWDQVWVLENFFPSSWFYSILEHLVLNREDISPEIPSSLVSKPNLVQKFRKIFKLHNQNLVLSDFSTIATHLSLKKSPFSQKRLFTGEHFLNPNHVHGSKWRQNSAEMTVIIMGRGGEIFTVRRVAHTWLRGGKAWLGREVGHHGHEYHSWGRGQHHHVPPDVLPHVLLGGREPVTVIWYHHCVLPCHVEAVVCDHPGMANISNLFCWAFYNTSTAVQTQDN